jgi:predicted nucleic acid-binding protein
MSDRVFIDTNVFCYLIDRKDIIKTKQAITFFKSIRDNDIHVSTQVIKEFCNIAIRKLKLTDLELKNQIQIFEKLTISDTSCSLIKEALHIKFRYQLQFYDSVIIASAIATNCDILYSEDLNNGQSIEGLKIINPFKD